MIFKWILKKKISLMPILAGGYQFPKTVRIPSVTSGHHSLGQSCTYRSWRKKKKKKIEREILAKRK